MYRSFFHNILGFFNPKIAKSKWNYLLFLHSNAKKKEVQNVDSNFFHYALGFYNPKVKKYDKKIYIFKELLKNLAHERWEWLGLIEMRRNAVNPWTARSAPKGRTCYNTYYKIRAWWFWVRNKNLNLWSEGDICPRSKKSYTEKRFCLSTKSQWGLR